MIKLKNIFRLSKNGGIMNNGGVKNDDGLYSRQKERNSRI